jgi:hypothetical protein
MPLQLHPLAAYTHHTPPPDARTGFASHKYLLVAILKCLQERHPARPAPPLAQRGEPMVHRWMREPSAVRETTPCIVLRQHHNRHHLSIAELDLAQVDVQARPLASWMRSAVPAPGLPDLDTLHFAMAPTLPGVPVLVHSVGAGGEGFTHMFNGGAWSFTEDDQFLFQAIQYARMVATVRSLSGPFVRPGGALTACQATVPGAPADSHLSSNLMALGRRYDHIAVHAALSELGDFHRDQRRVRVSPPAEMAAMAAMAASSR